MGVQRRGRWVYRGGVDGGTEEEQMGYRGGVDAELLSFLNSGLDVGWNITVGRSPTDRNIPTLQVQRYPFEQEAEWTTQPFWAC